MGDLHRGLDYPDADPNAIGYLIRTCLSLVQVPNSGAWGFGNTATYTYGDALTGNVLIGASEGLSELIRRYLRAFGPATVRDIQAWSGLTGLSSPVNAMRPELSTFLSEQGEELFDLPDAPLPETDSVPVRFLPEYDNVLLAHANRTRIIADGHRPRVFLTAGRVRATFLVNGFVHGAWKIERIRKRSILLLEPFAELDQDQRVALQEEGDRLLRFREPMAKERDVQII